MQLQPLEAEIKAANMTILTPFVSLDTPGKATVQVVILADPVIYTFLNQFKFTPVKLYFYNRMDTKFVSLEMKAFASCPAWIPKLISF